MYQKFNSVAAILPTAQERYYRRAHKIIMFEVLRIRVSSAQTGRKISLALEANATWFVTAKVFNLASH